MDIFKNYKLQREELLARIAQELQLNDDRINKMESAYRGVSKVLDTDEEFFEKLEVNLYAQGSKRIGTTIRPINGDDFDLDIVLHIYDPYYKHSPKEIYNALVRVISENDTYKPMMELKKRCVRLNYQGDFHMDILPACMPDVYEREAIKIPEKTLQNWSSGNPKGFASWFRDRTVPGQASVLSKFRTNMTKAKIETEELPEEVYTKTPLQRAVQLIKRYRDIYFKDDNDYAVSSIILTTLAAQFYQGENSIYETIDNVLRKIESSYTETLKKEHGFKIYNPVDPKEEFTDSWTDKHYQYFYEFIDNFHRKWENLKNQFQESKDDYIKLFGESIYKGSLKEQHKTFHQFSNNETMKSIGLILENEAYTDSKGKINSKKGAKNEYHHSYGGRYN